MILQADSWHIVAEAPALGRWMLAPNGSSWLPQNGRYPQSRYPAGVWPWARVREIVKGLEGPFVDGQKLQVGLESAKVCPCCGKHSYQEPLTLVLHHENDLRRQYRCEKHVGRLPCLIAGCGRTFKLTGDDCYQVRVICGRHWRLAPRYMRDRVRSLRKKAERLNWPVRLQRLYSQAFELTVRAAERRLNDEGFIDVAEIERMFG